MTTSIGHTAGTTEGCILLQAQISVHGTVGSSLRCQNSTVLTLSRARVHFPGVPPSQWSPRTTNCTHGAVALMVSLDTFRRTLSALQTFLFLHR